MLAECTLRPEALVRQLGRVPGKRGRRWKHLLGSPEAVTTSPEIEQRASVEPVPEMERGPSAIDRLESLEAAVAKLSTDVEGLREALAGLLADLGVSGE